MEMKAFYTSGGNGSVIQLNNGRFADTVKGDTSENSEPHVALDALIREAEEAGADWVAKPLFGDFDGAALAEYVGADDAAPIGLREAARYCGLAYSTLAQAAREGRLEARQTGATWLTSRAAIDEAIENGKLRPR